MEGDARSLATFPLNVAISGSGWRPPVRPLRLREVCFEIKIDGPGNVPLPVVQRSRSWLREFKPAVGGDNGRIGKVLGEPLHGC
jgi:hypothetical protein